MNAADSTLSQALAYAARMWTDSVALYCERRDQSASFAELDDLATALAAGLRSQAIGLGDRVGVMFRNDLEFAACWLGIVRAGATMVALNVHLTGPDLASILRAARPGLVLAADEFAPVIHDALSEASVPATRPVLFRADSTTVADLRERIAALLPGIADESAAQRSTTPRPESTANIQFTSGSTGASKGCLLSHRYWLTIGEMMTTHGPRLGRDDVLLSAQPFYYMDPQWNLVVCLLTGARLVVLERFRSGTFWRSVRQHRATFFYCLGVMPSMLLRTDVVPGERDTQVRYVACSAIPPGRHHELEERFGAPWYELYGSTETGLDCLVEMADHDLALANGTIGRPMPNREVRIVDEDGAPVRRGSVGRLVVRGVALSDGYLDGSSNTVGNGWYVSGDLATMDEEGYLYFAGREKDIIRRSGENVSAVQVEQVVQSHPHVRLCACVPVADDIRGEEIKAYVVLVPDSTVSMADLASHARAQLAYFKVPRYWEVRESLPLTPSDKIAKGDLRREDRSHLRRCYDAVDEVWLEQVAPLPPAMTGVAKAHQSPS